jgi:hypothetical protein
MLLSLIDFILRITRVSYAAHVTSEAQSCLCQVVKLAFGQSAHDDTIPAVFEGFVHAFCGGREFGHSLSQVVECGLFSLSICTLGHANLRSSALCMLSVL